MHTVWDCCVVRGIIVAQWIKSTWNRGTIAYQISVKDILWALLLYCYTTAFTSTNLKSRRVIPFMVVCLAYFSWLFYMPGREAGLYLEFHRALGLCPHDLYRHQYRATRFFFHRNISNSFCRPPPSTYRFVLLILWSVIWPPLQLSLPTRAEPFVYIWTKSCNV